MRTSDITVYIYKGARAPRQALLLAPEVAAHFGWSEGRVISERQAIDAEFMNAMRTLSECINAVYDGREEFWVSLRQYRERCKQEEGK